MDMIYGGQWHFGREFRQVHIHGHFQQPPADSFQPHKSVSLKPTQLLYDLILLGSQATTA